MDTGIQKALLRVALVLAAGGAGGLIASTVLASRAYTSRFEQARKTEQTLNVTGSARKRIRSDLAVWHIQVSGEGKELKEAYAVLRTAYERVEKFLKDAGFTPQEISAGPIDTHKRLKRDFHGNATDEVIGYGLSRSFTVTTSRVDAVAKPASEVTTLIQEGISVVSTAPEYHYTGLADLKIGLIGEAAKNARERADQIVASAGCRIVAVRNARVGVFQITPPDSTEVSDSGVNDTTTLEKDATSVVSLVFGITEE